MLQSQVILWSLAGYSLIGALFALWFAFHGVNTLDPAARHSPFLFRLLIIPGTIALWPVLAIKCREANSAPDPHP